MEQRLAQLEKRVAELEEKVAEGATEIELILDGKKIGKGLVDAIIDGVNRAESRRQRTGLSRL